MSTMICINGEMVELTGKAEEAYIAEREASLASETAPVQTRDLIAEIDTLTAQLARYEKTEAALISKGVLTAEDVKVEIVKVSVTDAEMAADALIVKVR